MSQLDHRLTSLEGTTDSVSQRVSGVEIKVSDVKRATGVDIEENQTKIQATFDKVKADFADLVESLESSKKDSSSKYGAVAASVEGIKKDIKYVSGKVGDVGVGLESLGSQVDGLASRSVGKGEEGDTPPVAPPAVTKEMYKAQQKKTSELENKIQMLQSALAAVEEGNNSVQKDIVKVGAIASLAKEQTVELEKKVKQVEKKKDEVEVVKESYLAKEPKMAKEREVAKETKVIREPEPVKAKVPSPLKAPAPAPAPTPSPAPASSPASAPAAVKQHEEEFEDSDSDDIDLSSEEDSDEEDKKPAAADTKTFKSPPKAKMESPKMSSPNKMNAAPNTPGGPDASMTSIQSIETDDSFLKDTPSPKKEKKGAEKMKEPEKGMVTPTRKDSKGGKEGSPRVYTPKRTPSVEEMHAAPTSLSSDDESANGDHETDTEPETDIA